MSSVTIRSEEPTLMRAYLRYGSPALVIWSLYLAGLWPGILTEDSISQWADMLAFRFAGYQSPLQVLINGLLTRIVFSPAIIAAAQIIALSSAFAAVLRACERGGAPRRVLQLTAWVVAL